MVAYEASGTLINFYKSVFKISLWLLLCAPKKWPKIVFLVYWYSQGK